MTGIVQAILEGRGELVTAAGAEPAGPGDVVVISPGEAHLARNAGLGDLVSLCFFPVPDLASATREAL